MNAKRLIFFDFDGVIVDSVDVKTKAFVQLYAPYGEAVMNAVRDYHLANAGVSRFDKFRHWQTTLVNGPADENTIADLSQRFGEEVKRQVIAAAEIPGAEAALKTLHRRHSLFVVSATPQDELRDIADARGLTPYFSGVYGSPDKKADIIARQMKAASAGSDRCIMIGDARADHEAAIANAIRFIGVVPAGATAPFPANIPQIPDLRNLPAMIDGDFHS